jgi:catechol 2,3-dioxygenase-like lactoylglutathione lyase family enzyme
MAVVVLPSGLGIAPAPSPPSGPFTGEEATRARGGAAASSLDRGGSAHVRRRRMFRHSHAFSGFSTNDLAAAQDFYGRVLGLEVSEEHGILHLDLAGGGQVVIYPKPDHEPASFTILNFPVADIATAVDALVAAGVTMERYEGLAQDERGIATEYPPPIAWFKDPAGNILSVIQTA